MSAQRKRVTVVGAGPVGSLLALHLARRGFEVDLLERRPDMRREEISAGRSINLALSTRGIRALTTVGLDREVLARSVPMRGRMMHSPRGELTYQPYGRDDSEYINSTSRADLNRMLMTRAEETGRVRIRFQQRVVAADLKTGDIRIRDESTGQESTESTETVIGTDGSSSAIRSALTGQSGSTLQEEVLDYGYKELTIPAGPKGTFAIEKHALHIWPRGSYMAIALPNEDGSFTVTLFLAKHGSPSFDELSTPESVRNFFARNFSDLLPLLPDLESDFFAHPTGSMVTVKCLPWTHDGRFLLLGDAAHAIVPFFGQGMNCGFEDVTVLDRLLERSDDWARVMAEFVDLRKENTDAIADLAVENFTEMRDKVADPAFLLEREVEKHLMREFPREYVSRYGLVTFSSIPYRVALEAGRIQAGILAELCRGLERADQVDLPRARQLIGERLSPHLRPHLAASQTRS